jgi:nucleotide-binding universal stress UspA family protein
MKLLVAIDNDRMSEPVVHTAAGLAAQLDAELLVCHVIPNMDYEQSRRSTSEAAAHLDIPAYTVSMAEERAQTLAEMATRPLRSTDLTIKTIGRVGHPANVILNLASQYKVDMIVMGFEGLRGLGKLRALGSVSRAVMENAPMPVLVVPARVAETSPAEVAGAEIPASQPDLASA